MDDDKKKPSLVSVIIPTYKRPHLLKRVVTDVLDQTYKNIEIVVVNDDPDSDIGHLIKAKENVTLINHKTNKKLPAARNTGIKRARGKYLAFHDDDDMWLAHKIERQVMTIESLPPEWVGVYSWFYNVNSWEEYQQTGKKKLVTSNIEGDIIYPLLSLNPAFQVGTGSSLLVRRETTLSFGCFDESMPCHEDWDFLLRLSRVGKLKLIKEPLWFRVGGNPPPAEKLVEYTRYFLKTEQGIIKKFDDRAIKKIYANQWFVVAHRWFAKGNFRMGWRYLRKVWSYTPLVAWQKYGYLIKDSLVFWFKKQIDIFPNKAKPDQQSD